MSIRWTQLLQSDWDALAAKANVTGGLLDQVNALIASGDWPGTSFDTRITPPPSSPPYYQNQPAFDFSASAPHSWLHELNRMRADYWKMIFGKKSDGVTPLNASAYLNSNNLVSGPWVVGVNDPDTYPAVNPLGPGGVGILDPTKQGILDGTANGMCMYKNVSFLYAIEDAKGPITITGKLNGTTFGTWTDDNAEQTIGLHPSSDVMQIKCGDAPGSGSVQWIVSPANTKGIWIANTLPVPAVNVFLDVDMPPYVQRSDISLGTDYITGVGGDRIADEDGLTFYPSFVENPPTTQPDNTSPIFASTQRQQALLQHGEKTTVVGGVTVNLGPNFNLINQTLQPRPASWLCIRNTDVPKTDFGFNTAGNPRQYFPKLKECFSHCGFYYDTPFGSQLITGQPIPQNGYCIFKIRAKRKPVKNAFGIYVLPQTGPQINVLIGQNRYYPDGTYNFAPFESSLALIGAGDTGTTGAGDSSGTFGGGGGLAGTFLTITIPPDQFDSGDVEMFIPVLGGNEIVWQCDSDVMVEAFGNWQPKFFGQCYNTFYNMDSNAGVNYQNDVPDSGMFDYCLLFTNLFDVSRSNIVNTNSSYSSETLYPMTPEIYNDMLACLTL